MGLWNSLGFVFRHPLTRERKLSTLVRIAKWQIGSRLVPGPVAVELANGAQLLVRPGMTGATGNIYVGLHEFEDMAFVMHFLRPGDLFADVGANVGSYTILAAAGAGADCISFEPDPSAFAWLLRNIDLNGVAARVDARRQAAGASDGDVSFTTGLDTVNHVAHASEGIANMVRVTTLDGALGDRCPNIVKIDVEGFETEVLAGARQMLGNAKLCCIVMEVAGSGTRYGFDEKKLREIMTQNGFGEYRYDPMTRKLAHSDAQNGNNSLFVRNLAHVERRLSQAPPVTVLGRSF